MPAATQDPEGRPDIDVLVVDDHRTFGDALCIAINLQPGMSCRGAVASAEDALARVGERCPDVVLLDIGLPGMDGITAIGSLRERCPGLRIVLITADDRSETLLAAVDAGADGFLPKGHPFRKVLEAIRRVDEAVVAEPLSLNRALRHLDRGHQGSPAPSGPSDLTEREYEILVLLAEGLPVKQVARRLDMSVNTCRGHVAALLRKFDVHSQLAAVVQAARRGMLPNLRADPKGDAPPQL